MSDSRTDAAAATAPDAANRVASAVAAAPFVRVFGHADGDALAACGLLAVALRDREIPFRVHVSADPAGDAVAAETAEDNSSGAGEPDADAESQSLVVSRGQRGPADLTVPARGDRQPASVAAATISRELGVDPDPVLALAGIIAAGETPGGAGSDDLLAAAKSAGLVERRPGVAVPTADRAADLAHSTRLDAPFSGDVDAAGDLLADLGIPTDSDAEIDAETRTALASAVAVATATADPAAPQAADSVEAALRPYATPTAPFATLGGYADVVSALAREAPGVAVSLAFGAPGAVSEAVDIWRDHAAAAHAALDSPTTGRYDGVFVLRVETDRPAVLPTVARLARAYRSPEPIALVVTDDPVDGRRQAALAATEPRGLYDAAATVAREFDGDAGGTPTQATLTVDGSVADGELIAAVREALDDD
ncbi:exonuclease RecJ [Halonotius aquaticus]|uniref:Exonuclease RecJ n=1 Tax=Halonotius aquaticus TaxID=2216978 RepID=A0A3A6PX81_9EURY|nr:exonuclease RecJ [Halonotius aquaticus]RJX43951.1 exonuclease RecJ [Halonotius aquaticus]